MLSGVFGYPSVSAVLARDSDLDSITADVVGCEQFTENN